MGFQGLHHRLRSERLEAPSVRAWLLWRCTGLRWTAHTPHRHLLLRALLLRALLQPLQRLIRRDWRLWLWRGGLHALRRHAPSLRCLLRHLRRSTHRYGRLAGRGRGSLLWRLRRPTRHILKGVTYPRPSPLLVGILLTRLVEENPLLFDLLLALLCLLLISRLLTLRRHCVQHTLRYACEVHTPTLPFLQALYGWEAEAFTDPPPL